MSEASEAAPRKRPETAHHFSPLSYSNSPRRKPRGVTVLGDPAHESRKEKSGLPIRAPLTAKVVKGGCPKDKGDHALPALSPIPPVSPLPDGKRGRKRIDRPRQRRKQQSQSPAKRRYRSAPIQPGQKRANGAARRNNPARRNKYFPNFRQPSGA